MLYILLALWCFLVLLLSCLLVLTAFISIKRRRVDLPCPPFRNFFLGHALEMRNPNLNIYLEWAQKYGTVYKLYVFHRILIVPCDNRWIKEILMSGKYPKSELVYKNGVGTLFGKRVLGDGLVSVIDRDLWHRHRSILNPSFHKNFLLSEVIDVFNDYGDRLVEKLRVMSREKKAINMYEMFSRVTMDIISHAAFGFHLGAMDNPDVSLLRCIYVFFRGQQLSFTDPIGCYTTKNGRKQVQEIRDCCQQLRATGIECVMKRLQLIQSGENVPQDSLTALLRSYYDQHGSIQTEELERLVDEFITIFVAGHETTAGTMSLLMWLLECNSPAKEKLVGEIDALNGESRRVDREVLEKLEYMNCAIKETLRLYPPAPATLRDTTEPTNIHGVDLPAGVHMIIYFYVIHRMPQYYDKPNDFIPERFESEENRVPCTYLPFSLGPRFCIGKEFALIEAKVLLTKLMRTFKFELCRDRAFEIEFAGTIKPKDGLYMTLTEK